MDKGQAIEVARKYKSVVAEHYPLKALYLYGSYSKGGYTDESDIDIAVVVDNIGNDYLKKSSFLWTLGRKVNVLIEPILLKADINNPLYYDILRTGTLID